MLLVSVSASKAQKPAGNHSVALSWSVAVPSGNDGFLNNVTLVTPNVSWEYSFSPTISAGMSLGLMYGDEKERTTDRIPTGLVSGPSDRRLTLVPLQAHVRYFPLGKKEVRFQPYVTIAAGAQYGRFHITGDQIQTNSTDNFAVVLTPDLGVRFYPRAGSGFYLDASCYWQYGGNSWSYTNTGSQQFIGFRITATFSFH